MWTVSYKSKISRLILNPYLRVAVLHDICSEISSKWQSAKLRASDNIWKFEKSWKEQVAGRQSCGEFPHQGYSLDSNHNSWNCLFPKHLLRIWNSRFSLEQWKAGQCLDSSIETSVRQRTRMNRVQESVYNRSPETWSISSEIGPTKERCSSGIGKCSFCLEYQYSEERSYFGMEKIFFSKKLWHGIPTWILVVGGSSRYLELLYLYGARVELPDKIQYAHLNLNFR